ncbi:MAG: phosphate acyltransferase [Clostridia bacterium]|nr:phosphate acyltransferase [Clostridia bacterium]
MSFKKQIFNMAKQDVKTIVFPEAGFSDKIIEAVRIATQKKLAKAILLGDESALYLRYSALADENIQIINPKTSELRNLFIEEICELRKSKGVTKEECEKMLEDPIYFATMMVKDGYADGMVSGTESFSASTFKPALQLIKGVLPNKLVSSSMLVFIKKGLFKVRPILISDCALVENPTKENLVEIAKNSVDFWKMLFYSEPKVAFLSYSTKGSAKSESIAKMRSGTDLFKKTYPEVVADGELQIDVALSKKACKAKNYIGQINGEANILIVPDINSGSLLVKALHSVAGYTCIGPVAQGFARPVNDVTRNASINEIVMLIAITVIQAQLY